MSCELVGVGGVQQNIADTHFLKEKEFPIDITTHIENCIKEEKPFSLCRCGDGELWVLSCGTLYSMEYVRVNCPWVNNIGYCGTTLPNVELQQRLINAINNANVVGIFNDDWTRKTFQHLNLQVQNTCYAFINIGWAGHKAFVQLIRDYKPLLIGQNVKLYASKFQELLGVTCPTLEISNYTQIDWCLKEMGNIDYQLAFVSCAVPAKIICVEATTKYGKVHIDTGHCFDNAFNPVFEHCFLK